MHRSGDRSLRLFALWGLLLAAGASCASVELWAQESDLREGPVDYVRDVEPILRRSCYSCHGPETQESGLRLDHKQRALTGGDLGRVIEPGKAAQSRLIAVVRGADDELGLMPPEGEGTPLTEEEISLLRRWIDQGAVWPDDSVPQEQTHWAFQPIRRPALPQESLQLGVTHPVDAFILQRLIETDTAPSPAADRHTLIRRLYLDLLGLLPPPEHAARFVADPRPDAYERLVDELLASPHFGERWGRLWLDLARFADSDGYEKDRARPHAWRYREWVIGAYNSDLPFDQFTIEQIAGDLLPDATVEQRVASGFHRNTLHNTEGGIDPEEDRVKKTIDRTNTVGTIWLGLTVGCAQCHSHKYDPLTQREYYSLYAYFNNLDEVEIDAPLPIEQERLAAAQQEHRAQRERLLSALRVYERDELPAAQRRWEATAQEAEPQWYSLQIEKAESRHGAELQVLEDQALLVKGQNKASDRYTITATVTQPALRGLRLEVLPHASLVEQGPGRAENGNFVLTDLRITAAPVDGQAAARAVQLASARADYEQGGWPAAAAINRDPADGWAVGPKFGERHVLVVQFAEALGWQGATRLTITLDQQYKGTPHNLGHFRLTATDFAGPLPADRLPQDVVAALAIEPAQRDDSQQRRLAEYYGELDPQRLALRQAIADHERRAPASGGVQAQAVVQVAEPRTARVMIRGDFLNPGDPVTPRGPAFLPDVQSSGEADRLAFARWLTHPENPLPARVAVNRLWQRIFGRGLVKTVDDFGLQGEAPSHPQLLDWLAAELIRQDWSRKEILRLIVTSAAYQRSSAARPDLEERDPENVWLARQNRTRVEAEVIRDVALDASGLLDRRIGGPSVRPPQPAEYSQITYAGSAKWVTSRGGDAYRRGLYTFFQRTSPYPMLITFDAPDSTECCAERVLSNTPLQALTLWNDPVFVECAAQLGRRIAAAAPGLPDQERVPARIDYAFQVCLSRSPSAAEVGVVERLYREQLAMARADSPAAEALTAALAPLPDMSREELAAWVIVARTLLNLDEFISKE